MQYTIVTGMSGSGKTKVIRYLEDMGYFCIDNMPPMLIPKFSEMLTSVNGKFNNVAFVVDTRVGDMINELLAQIDDLKQKGYDCKLLYINADDETLVKRYKETRRMHPIENTNGLLASIRQERKMLSALYEASDYVIDTSHLTAQGLLQELKERLGLTYFFISHNLNVVYQVSDRVGVMYLGKMVEIAAYDQLYEKRYHPYTEALLSAIPQVDADDRTERIHLTGEVPSPSNPPSGCPFHTRCPKACDICSKEIPQLKEIEKGHFVACHLYQ